MKKMKKNLRQAAYADLSEMIRVNRNHPSIIVWYVQ